MGTGELPAGKYPDQQRAEQEDPRAVVTGQGDLLVEELDFAIRHA